MVPRVALCHFCEIHGPSMVFCTSIYPLDMVVNTNPDLSKDPCDGCSFQSRGSEGFVCVDDDTGHKYMSCSTIPEGDRVNVQQACVRSLSCEVCPDGREGIIYFGDDDRGHVMSYCFVLKDSQARGFQRTYSIILISDSKPVLIENWKNIVHNLEQIISKLKRESNRTYELEVSSNQDMNKERRSIMLDTAIQVAGRGRTAMNTQRSASKARSLSDLTSQDAIFVSLHLDFVSLLKKFHNKIVANQLLMESIDHGQGFRATRTTDKASCLRTLYAILGQSNFRIAACHTLIGHQIVVKSKNEEISHVSDQIATTLCELLPIDGIRVALDSDKYFEDTFCNLISLSTDADVPNEVITSNDHLLVEVSNVSNSANRCSPTSNLSITCSKPCPSNLPTLLISLEKMIQDTTYSDECLNSYLDTIKTEWMDKVRKIDTIIKNGCRDKRHDDDIKSVAKSMEITKEADINLVKSWIVFVDYEGDNYDEDINNISDHVSNYENSIEYHFDSSQDNCAQSYSNCN